MSGKVKIILSVVVIVGAAGYLLAETLTKGEALTYFHTADEVIVNKKEFVEERIRIGGYVEECSILQKKGTLEYRFEVRPDHPHNLTAQLKHPAAKGKMIAVEFTGIVPDTFKDNAEVIVTGSLGEDGVFRGTELIAKCPSKYEAGEQNLAQAAQRPPKKDCTTYQPSTVEPIQLSAR